jgi:hypothetical protein
MLHIVADVTNKGILNIECAVLSPSNSNAAVPLEATDKA